MNAGSFLYESNLKPPRTLMTLGEFRCQLESYRQAADEEATTFKDSYLVLNRLCRLYRKFGVEERKMANQVIEEWALSKDEKIRFDALALIDEIKITTAIPTLRQLASRLASSSAPGAPYEMNKVNRIVEHLGVGLEQ